jgi:type I restriction enzyme M protein
LKIVQSEIKTTIFAHPEFEAYSQKVNDVFATWKKRSVPTLKSMEQGNKPKKLIHDISETLLEAFGSLQLIDGYDVYQHLMTYWNETMQDDVYVISDEGWKTGGEVYRIKKATKQKDGKSKEKEVEGMDGIESKLIKPYLMIDRYFETEKKSIEKLEGERDAKSAEIEALEEEHGNEDGLLNDAKNDKDKITTASVKDRLKKIKSNKSDIDEIKLLESYLKLQDQVAELNKQIKLSQKELEMLVWEKYAALSMDEIKTLVVDDKWISHLEHAVQNEMQRISQRLTQRIKELAERYETPMPQMLLDVKILEEKVNTHLAKMGFVW